MKIRINVTAEGILPGELETTKEFVSRIEYTDRMIRQSKGQMTLVEDALLRSIFMRITQDKDNLIRWHREGNVVSAYIDIIPAIDYIPQN